jgi:hypothetical protein
MKVLFLLALLISTGWARTPIVHPESAARDRYLGWVRRLPHPQNPEAYRFISEIHRDLAPWVRERPGVVRPFVIGRSVEKRPIWAFRVSRPGTEIHSKVLIFAGIHALEWVSTETATSFLEDLITMPPAGVEVVVVPLLNPDGRDRVEADRLSGRVMYRRGNALKVDLNRDFEVNREIRAIWHHLIPGYYGHTKKPLSQPESRALDRLLSEQFDVAISLHSFGGFVYTPWAGLWERPKDWETLHRLGTIMSQAQGAHAYKVRQLSRWGFFFRAQGAEIDHIYGKYGTLAYLIELSRSGINPFRPYTLRDHFYWYNPPRPDRHVEKGHGSLQALVHTLAWDGGLQPVSE